MRETLDQFYELVRMLLAADEQGRPAREYTAMSPLPEGGVHFLLEPGELRSGATGEHRIAYVGAHGTTHKSTLWTRLKQHRGSESGNGNHHGSVLRSHIGAALIARDGADVPTWGKGQDNSAADRTAELPYEFATSVHIREMRLLWVETPVGGEGKSLRNLLADNAVALLSNGMAPLDPPSGGWLGRYAAREEIRESGLWNVQGVRDRCDPGFMAEFAEAVRRTRS